MKKVFAFLTIALSVCALFNSCAKQQEQDNATGTRQIQFSASVGKFSVKATDTAFEKGDAVGVFATGESTSFENLRLEWNGQALVPASPVYWGEGQAEAEKTQFIAYYPYKSDMVLETFSFTVKADQTSHTNYTASDFMGAVTEASPASGKVHLGFEHLMSKLVLKIDNRTNSQIAKVFIGDVYGRVSIDPEEQYIAPSGEKGTIQAGKVSLTDGNQAWAIIIVPQSTRPVLKITTVDQKQFTYSLPEDIEFQSGHRYNASVVISESSISTDFTSDIADWVDDEDIQFGQDGDDPQQEDVVYAQTVQEVLEGEEGLTYLVGGTVSQVVNVAYGNIYIEDPTGQLYIYGLVNAEGQYPRDAEGWYTPEFGLVPGDIVSVKGPKSVYNGTVELVKAQLTYIDRTPLGSLASAYEFGSDESTYAFPVRSSMGQPKASCSERWVSVNSIQVFVSGDDATWYAVEIKAQPNTSSEDRTAIVTLYTDDTHTVPFYVSQKGAPQESTLAAIIASEDNTYASFASTVYAVSARGFVVYDGSDALFVYTGASGVVPAVGDKVSVKGTKTTYNGVPEISNTNLSVTVVSSGEQLLSLEYQDVSAELGNGLLFRVAYPVSVKGELQVNGSTVTVSTADGTCQLYWPNEALIGEVSEIAGEQVVLEGFYNGCTASGVQSVVAVNVSLAQSGDDDTKGTLDNPYLPSEIAAKILAGSIPSDNVYIKGKVSAILYTFSAAYGTGTFWLSDDGVAYGISEDNRKTSDPAHDFECYGLYWYDGQPWVEGNGQVAIGDEVIVYGKTTVYNGVAETANKQAWVYSVNGVTAN